MVRVSGSANIDKFSGTSFELSISWKLYFDDL